MKQANRFTSDMLDFDLPDSAHDVIWRACKPISAFERDGAVVFSVPFEAYKRAFTMQIDGSKSRKLHELVVRAYGDDVVRLTCSFTGEIPGDKSVMLEWHASLKPQSLSARSTVSGWDVIDSSGVVRFRVRTQDAPTLHWSDLIPDPPEAFDITVIPDGVVEVPFMTWDTFFPAQVDSLPLAYVEHAGAPSKSLFALHADHNEKYAGTGERFAGMSLAGRTFALENTDALGVNNRRCYKNIPFFVSSRNYGTLILTTSHLRLSLADISTRAAQAMIEDSTLDLFLIGGGDIERVVYNYRRITGIPHNVPAWSYGTWMSRMSYWTAEQTTDVARKLREGGFPSDVIHLDTGWFDEDWVCDWEFSKQKYPDPAAYMREMRRNGFRISLWQRPSIGRNNRLSTQHLRKVSSLDLARTRNKRVTSTSLSTLRR